jgi:hypothetical protein
LSGAASQPTASSAHAGDAAAAAAPAPKKTAKRKASASTNITDVQRAQMLKVFADNTLVWGENLPAATPVNPTAATRPLMDLINATGLSRDKLKHHYTSFRAQNHPALATSLDDRRAELDVRLKLDEVLSAARVLAGEHTMCKLNSTVKLCVDKLLGGACKADCVARLEQLVGIVAEHTVCEVKEVRAAESSLGFAIIDSDDAWERTVPDAWMSALGDDGYEAAEGTVVLVRHVMNGTERGGLGGGRVRGLERLVKLVLRVNGERLVRDHGVDEAVELVDRGKFIVYVPRHRDLLGGSEQGTGLESRVAPGRRDVAITPARRAEPRAVGDERELKVELVRDSKWTRSPLRLPRVHEDHLLAVKRPRRWRRGDRMLDTAPLDRHALSRGRRKVPGSGAEVGHSARDGALGCER